MLERFASQVLNRYIGQYVENFNQENLSIGIMQGAVELEGLLLRKDVLREFDLPEIEVTWGYIGKITLRIPSYKSYSEPWVIDINKLYLVVNPNKNSDKCFDKDEEKKLQEERKFRQLAELEERWNATKGASKSLYSVWQAYSSSIVTNIVENLQVRLFDLHIRYEDDVTLPDTFACGIHIKVLSAQSTDANWEPTSFSAKRAMKKWKKMHLSDMSLYWDTQSYIIGNLSHDQVLMEMETYLQKPDTSEKTMNDVEYMLCPVSGEARFTRACSHLPLRSKKNPRLTLDLDLPRIPLQINKIQYKQMLALASEFTRWDIRKESRSGRPSQSVKGNASVWWRWAINVHMKKIKIKRERRALKFVAKRITEITSYVRLYREFLYSKYISKSETEAEVVALQKIEQELSFSELRILRELVYKEIDDETRKRLLTEKTTSSKLKLNLKKSTMNLQRVKKGPSWGGWGGWLGKWKNSPRSPQLSCIEDEDAEDSLSVDSEAGDDLKNAWEENASTSQETLHDSVFKDLNDAEFNEMFGDELAEQDTTDTFLKRDSVLLKLNFTLKSGSLTLTHESHSSAIEKSNNGIVSLEFNTVKLASEWRPRYGTHEIKIDLGGIAVKDLDPLNTRFCDIVKPCATSRQRPTSPITVTPPGGSFRSLASDLLNNFRSKSQAQPQTNDTSSVVDEESETPVFSLTYEKLSSDSSKRFSNRLEIVTAPLSLTFIPGILDRLKSFFKTLPSTDINNDDVLTATAKQRYEIWMRQTKAEVRNRVKGLMEGRTVTEVNSNRWAVSLDIFAPKITIPENWSDPDCNVVVLNLGHMTFENYNKGELHQHEKCNSEISQSTQPSVEDYDSDEDDFVTPPDTPPNPLNASEKYEPRDNLLYGANAKITKGIEGDEKQVKFESTSNREASADDFDHKALSEQMLREKLYESYHLHFADLQVLVTSSRVRWETIRQGGKSPLDLVERFSVDLIAEKRVVSTDDPQYPTIVLSGNLPHLVMHISHEKVHAVLKCLDQFKQIDTKVQPANFTSQFQLGKTGPSVKGSGKMRTGTSVGNSDQDSIKAFTKQLTCNFLIDEISVFLEHADKGVLSVLEVRRIQTRYTQRPYDNSACLSIYSILLVDLMQRLGHDFELLLASHRNVSMDVGSGNMLDSGTTSPFIGSLGNSLSGPSTGYAVKRCSSESQFERNREVKMSSTNNVLHTVAENLQRVAYFTDKYFMPFRFDSNMKETKVASGDEKSDTKPFPPYTSNAEYLITFEFKNLRKGSPDLSVQKEESGKVISACNVVNANFNNLDVVFNSNTWVTIFDFMHKLNPSLNAGLSADAMLFKQNDAESTMKFDPHQIKVSPGITHLPLDSADLIETCININFKQLNVLMLRNVVKYDSTFGRKVATLTMQGAKVDAKFSTTSQEEGGDIDQNVNAKLSVSGSVASLQLQDLTPDAGGNGIAQGLTVLSVGTPEMDEISSSKFQDDHIKVVEDELDSQTKFSSDAFSFDFKQGFFDTVSGRCANLHHSSVSEPFLLSENEREGDYKKSASDYGMFSLNLGKHQTSQPTSGTDSSLIVKVASACYMHSPRLIAELLALSDETSDFINLQMTTATKQAYKDMARSIIDKVSDYSMAVLGKSMMAEDPLLEDSVSSIQLYASPSANSASSKTVASLAKFSFFLQMQTPIVALPKFPGSFELLVASLGQITIQNDHDIDSGAGPLDNLYIEFGNLNLRSHRQRDEEVAMKKAAEQDKGSSGNFTIGPSITKLKRDSVKLVNFRNSQTSVKNSNFPSDIQILHKTSLKMSVHRKPYVPLGKSDLDVRKCCKISNSSCCAYGACCNYFASFIGAVSEKKMCISVQAASAITVTLSKYAFEQVLKTLDNVSYGGDIDAVTGEENTSGFTSYGCETETRRKPEQSLSAPSLIDSHASNEKIDCKSSSGSTSSHQSTPRPGKEFVMFELPGLDSVKATPNWPQNIPQRKYTPISANVTIPCLIFQLSGDLSEGEQGIVKVTLQEFTAGYEKENRFGTSIDLSLGSLDVEDLLQEEATPNRHIVVSFSASSQKDKCDALHKVDYLSTSCPSRLASPVISDDTMTTSLPSLQKIDYSTSNNTTGNKRSAGVFRPYESFNLTTGAFGSLKKSSHRKSHCISNNNVQDKELLFTEQPPTPPSSPILPSVMEDKHESDVDNTLVRIRAFMVDGKSEAYSEIYERVNRRINIDFNSLDCKVNLQTWVVLLDFFGIGTSPKKTFQLDAKTEQTFSWDKRLDVRSFYENQPDDFINSEIDFTVRCFSLTFNKPKYELLKASVAGLQSHGQIRDGTLHVFGQLGDLSVSDLSPNGSLYRERFIFTGDKALDFDITKFDEYDHELQREFDISVKLRMSSIRYVHTQRFQNETVAYCQHFQQLQEVLGRMRAASVGQKVRTTSCRQARVLLNIEADTPIILIPESSHADRVLVANLGHITVRNQFLINGMRGTLSHKNNCGDTMNSDPRQQSTDSRTPESPGACILDVIHVDLIDMDLFTASYSKSKATHPSSSNDNSVLAFPSYVVNCNKRPLLKEKAKLELQMERNLEKEIADHDVPDTALSARLSSVYCSIDHTQYWLIRGILDHNAGEAIPDFPQPTAFLQPSKLQTVLTGSVHTGLSMDFYLSNVSIELLQQHATDCAPCKSLGRLDFITSLLSYRAFSDNIKTTNLSCEDFHAHDTRFINPGSSQATSPTNQKASSVFTTVLGAVDRSGLPSMTATSATQSLLQFEINQRSGPGFMEVTALLNNMRVYLILNWLLDMKQYIIMNPDQTRCDSLRDKTAQLMATYGQEDTGNMQELDSTGRLQPEIRSNNMKMSFTDTEFVVVEDCSRFDSDAVILHSTAILNFTPDEKKSENHGPLSCSLQSLEVFSCQLDKEVSTALSIIDPVTVNFEVRPIKQTDVSHEEIIEEPLLLDRNLLDIHVTDLNMRVSYNDVMLFLDIFKSLPLQAGLKVQGNLSDVGPTKKSSSDSQLTKRVTQGAVERLTQLGYSKTDVVHALTINNGSTVEAGSWLVEHSTLQTINTTSPPGKKVPLEIARINVNVDIVRICLIDDCADDCDVPLTELIVGHLGVRQALASEMKGMVQDLFCGQMGSASFKLSGDYYNRLLSLWEPFLEPWRCHIGWKHDRGTLQPSNGKWRVDLQATDRFDLSVTSSLIDTVKKTLASWRQDYTHSNNSKLTRVTRKRQPLVPYLLRNRTGSPLYFVTQTAALRDVNMLTTGRLPSSSGESLKSWLEVAPGDDCSFNFATSHEKQRHKRTQTLTLHQISVRVGEWRTLQPVTVSKVGTYFRHAFKEIMKSSTVYEPAVPIRVVFAVTLEGSAQKVVTVRSALAIRSRVKIPVQLQLKLPTTMEEATLPILHPNETQYIPIPLTQCSIKIRPFHKSISYDYSVKSIRWQDVPPHKQEQSHVVKCTATDESIDNPFNFAVCIQRKPYPSYEEACEVLSQQEDSDHHSELDWETYIPQLPGHTIIILPPVVISNLLPCDLHYYIKNRDVEGTLKPGMDATPHAVHVFPTENPQPSLIVGCLPENFKSCRELVVPSVVKSFQMRMSVKDFANETLVLNVRILWRLNCSVKISIMAGYWIVNRTGLPIVVRQDGTSFPAAGQYETHEVARSLQPLLFSYANRDRPYLCTMRLGKRSRLDDMNESGNALKGIPTFCERFSTDGGSCTRNLKMITGDRTPNREFYIGISVHRGWGRYLHTHIVTLAPRFMLFNRTRDSRLSFAQRHTISYTADSAGTSCHLTIMPGSSVVFHWPRVDLDTLLCVRLADEPSCHWSGGFFIDRTNAFHVALRLTLGVQNVSVGQLHPLAPHCVFLNVEVTLENATYCVSVGNADPSLVPPPLRVDNVSPAPIIFKQVGTDESYNTEVLAETQLAYACDEPCLPQVIQCCVLGGSHKQEMDMCIIGSEKQLYYENYIYITFASSPHLSSTLDHLNRERVILVLDVQGGQKSHYITLQPLRSGKRSQLWRMTSEGRIYHEGSSPPEKDSRSHDSVRRHHHAGLVLDIAEMAINQSRQLDQGILLALRQFDERRRSTQTWSFGDDGRLKCKHRNLCVQASDLSVGSPVVLASFDEKRVCLPKELCSHHKLIPGSGVLSLKVVRDGPTRVLRIVDIRQKRAKIFSKDSEWTILEATTSEMSLKPAGELNLNYAPRHKITASFSMPLGVGISLISNLPEELLYLTMNGVHLEVVGTATEQVFSLRVQKIQIDNQLLDGYPRVMLHPGQSFTSQVNAFKSTSDRSPSSSIDPLISVKAIRQPSASRIYEIYKSLEVNIGRLSIAIEERLMLKLLHFVGYGPALSERDTELLNEAKMDLNLRYRNFADDSYKTTTRFYFDNLHLSAAPLRLSVLTASRLVPELKVVKRALTFPLVQFERAPVAIQAYHRRHLFENIAFVLADLSKHLRDQLKSQAAKILGSVDFLGNPIGLIGDVKAGVVSAIARGNLQSMVKHITHGISDSTAKFTSTLSDGLGEISMDEAYEDRRRAIQANARSSNAGSHVVAGLQGLMAGVIGGLTSVVTQPVRGAQNDGAKGFFTGIGKGLLGTVTKPVTGVLDLASESASAVREATTPSDRIVERTRQVRCCHSFQGCLQCFSEKQAEGQSFLYSLNKNDFSEHFYALSHLSHFQHENNLVLITNKKVYFIEGQEPDPDHVFIVVDYAFLLNIRVLPPQVGPHGSIRSSPTHHDDKIMLELTIKAPPYSGQYSFSSSSSSGNHLRYQIKKPCITCQDRNVAERICQQINYAKTLASQQTETLQCDPNEDEAEDRAFDMEV